MCVRWRSVLYMYPKILPGPLVWLSRPQRQKRGELVQHADGV